MAVSYFDVVGDLVKPDDLRIPKAREVALNLGAGRIMFATLVECRKNSKGETVVFDLEVEVPQVRKHPVFSSERIAAIFEIDPIAPIVHALREDFPRVPHLNLLWQEYPRSLCLYDEPYADIKRRWTPPRFVHDIRSWLAATARGDLHQDDQPLEPLLADFVGHIVLPHSIHDADHTVTPLFVNDVRRGQNGKLFLVAQAKPTQDAAVDIVASVHRCPPQIHGVIHRRPATLADLTAMTEVAGLKLVAELRDRLKDWQANNNAVMNSQLLLVILFPKQRHARGEVEAVDTWAFFLGDAAAEGEQATGLRVRDLGTRIGLWDLQDNVVGLLLAPDTSKRGEDVGLDVLNVAHALDRSMAASLNGHSEVDELCLVAVGVGALGSQVVMNLARAGFGTWTLIDHDRLMPHNVARHALDGEFVGRNKAEAVAFSANTIVQEEADLFTALPVNVLFPGDRADDLSKALAEADVILDMSTSLSAARMLTLDGESGARRFSLFMTPSGRDLVLLAEDAQRAITLDALEMQYYRAVLGDERLEGHLDQPDGRRRYGQTCRDITSPLPQHLVALHSAQGARAVRDALGSTGAAITIWCASGDGAVRRVDVSPAAVVRQETNGWMLVTDGALLAKLSRLRQPKLPNETGGVLLGSFDVERRILYIADALPSPPDSEEWPTLYIRGCHGLAATVEALTKKTHGMLEYVGEWHSHPEGASTSASQDDRDVFAWIGDLMQGDGLPAVMMIVGDGGGASCYVEQISTKCSLLREVGP